MPKKITLMRQSDADSNVWWVGKAQQSNEMLSTKNSHMNGKNQLIQNHNDIEKTNDIMITYNGLMTRESTSLHWNNSGEQLKLDIWWSNK